MTPTQYLAWFIFMAVAITAILVVGTLGAADLLPRRHRRNEFDVVDDLAPLGASLSAGSQLRAPSPVETSEGRDRPAA